MLAAAYTALAKSMSQCRSHTKPQARRPGSGTHGGSPGGRAPGADDVVPVLCVIVLPQRVSYDDCLGACIWRMVNRAVAVLAILVHCDQMPTPPRKVLRTLNSEYQALEPEFSGILGFDFNIFDILRRNAQRLLLDYSHDTEGCATEGTSNLFSGPEVRFLVLDDVPQSRAPQMLEQRIHPGRRRGSYGYDPLFSNEDADGNVFGGSEFLEDDRRFRNHADPWRNSRTGGWELEDVLARPQSRLLARNNTLWRRGRRGGGVGRGGGGERRRERGGSLGARRQPFSSLLDEFDPALTHRAAANESGLVRLGVHRIWYPGGQVPIEVKLKPRDDSRSYVVVIAKTVPDLKNLSKVGAGDARAGGRQETGGGRGAVAVPRTQSMYTYRVPAAYLPKEPRHLFVTVIMLPPGPGVDLRLYRRYKLIAIIGDCRFLDEDEYDKSPNCKSAMVAGRTEVLCVCKVDVSTTKKRVVSIVPLVTTPTTPKVQLREKFKPSKTLERRLFQLPTLTPVKNCTLAQRTYFHRLLQREYPLDNITTAELLAVQIVQAENVLNNQTLYWTCNAFAPIDEDRVILEKAKEAAVDTLRKSVRVLTRLPAKTRRGMQELPSIIRFLEALLDLPARTARSMCARLEVKMHALQIQLKVKNITGAILELF
ncbi:hypothetical protein HPB51_002877 [Rhipicephalus microplus]|uniref:Uncharacterized protein n=1 Tax=Rhipicephalus microplus TaxID=6941 RepID=A0A9J6EX46_RHIMP|nr:hypothetical protein HPB51_002877 [Rhipicephalus microplus]